MKTTHPCDGPLPAVFFGPPRRHHRQTLRGKEGCTTRRHAGCEEGHAPSEAEIETHIKNRS